MLSIKWKMATVAIFTLFISASISAQLEPSKRDTSIELDHFRLLSRVDVHEVDDDLSGITFSAPTQSLFAVTNEPPQLLEMSLEGDVKRVIPLIGFNDTEGVTHIQGNRFAIVEERKRRVVFIEVDAKTEKIEHQNCENISLSIAGLANKGLEGIAWSEQEGLLFVKEDEPREIYQLNNNREDSAEFSSFVQREESQLSLEDVAGLHSMKNGNILFLSEASRMLLELSSDGKLLSKKNMGAFGYDPLDLFYQVEQPEGVTLSDDGRLFVVSEPNQLFIFQKPAA